MRFKQIVDPTGVEHPGVEHPGVDPTRGGPWVMVLCLLAAVAVQSAGCSGGKKSAKKAAGNASAAEESTATDIDPDTAMVVDGGKIEVSSPAGWSRAAQSKDYLVKYVPSRRKTFPSIVVLGSDAPEDMAEVDADTQKEFVSVVAKSLAGTYSKDGKSTLVKKPAPVKLGPHFGVAWSAPATVKVDGVRESIDRMSYALVLGGRMYTVEVRAPKGKLDDEGRAAAKSVAAAIGPPSAEKPADEPKPEPTDEPKPEPSDEPKPEPAADAAAAASQTPAAGQ